MHQMKTHDAGLPYFPLFYMKSAASTEEAALFIVLLYLNVC